MATQKKVKEYALAAKDWIYVWGANGERITEKLMEKLHSLYGSANYNSAYYQNKLKGNEGKNAADCSGFMYPLSGYDNTADGYFRGCERKDKIDTLPEDKVCLVFKQASNGTKNHIGIYLGDGTVAEMASSKLNYQHRKLSANSWTHWGMPKWIDYSEKLEIAPVQKPGWIKDEKGWRYRREDGTYPRNTWMLINHHWYLFGEDGYMLTGWQMKNGKWYYLETSGEYEGACWHGTADNDGSMERWYVT